MGIDCALVALETVPVAKGSVTSNDYTTFIMKIILKVDWKKTTVQTFEQNKSIVFLCVENENTIFLGVCDSDTSVRQRFRFLNDLKKLWHEKYGNQEMNLTPNSKDAEFGPIIVKLIQNYNLGHSSIPKSLEDNNQMTDYLRSSNNIDEFGSDEQNVNEIKQNASVFRHTAQIKCRLFYQRYRILIILIPIVILIILIILFSVCGFTFKKC